MKHVFIGADPGTSNYGYSVIKLVNAERLRFRILECGMLTDVVTNLTDKPAKLPKSRRRKRQPNQLEAPFHEQVEAFRETWDELFETYAPLRTTMERFQTRGLKGKTIEAVSMMNMATCLSALDFNSAYEIITAATWKNQVNRVQDLTDFYKLGLTPHTADSCFIAVYGALKFLDRKYEAVDFKYLEAQMRRFAN